MTPEQKNLVQKTFLKIVPISEIAAGLFYDRLFELEPDLRHLFHHDINEQGRKLMQLLTIAVRGLDRPDELLPVVQTLGARHSGYGVKEHHYEIVGNALIWTLEKGLGDDFTDQVKEAWTAVYYLLSQTMKDAAAKAENSEMLATVAA